MKATGCTLMLFLFLPAWILPQSTPAPPQRFILLEARVQEIAADGSQAELVPEPVSLSTSPVWKEEVGKVKAGETVFLGTGEPGEETVIKDFGRNRYKDVTGKVFGCPLSAYRVLDKRPSGLRVAGVEPVTVKIADAGLRKRLLALGTGSTVKIEGVQQACQRTAERMDVQVEEDVPRGAPFWLLAVLLGLFLGATAFTLGSTGALGLLLGKDGLYSSSKFQLALWFTVLITTYLATLYMRLNFAGLVGGVSIPQNLLLMSGLSALSFVGAKAIKQGQVSGAEAQRQQALQQAQAAEAAAQAAVAPGVPAIMAAQQTVSLQVTAATAASAALEAQAKLNRLNQPATRQRGFWFDLVHDEEGKPSLSKFQMIVITLIAAGLYLFKASEFLGTVPLQGQISLPDVDAALLATFGLGQGAYLALKAAGEGS